MTVAPSVTAMSGAYPKTGVYTCPTCGFTPVAPLYLRVRQDGCDAKVCPDGEHLHWPCPRCTAWMVSPVLASH